MIQELKKRLDFEVNSIQFVVRDGIKYLDVELPDADLKSIEIKSKLISLILDEIDKSDEQYYLNVYSSGTEKEINIQNINLFIEQYLSIKLNKPLLDKLIWEGDLVENNLTNIVLKVNNKGRFQKLSIDKTNIAYIKTTAKLRKEK